MGILVILRGATQPWGASALLKVISFSPSGNQGLLVTKGMLGNEGFVFVVCFLKKIILFFNLGKYMLKGFSAPDVLRSFVFFLFSTWRVMNYRLDL